MSVGGVTQEDNGPAQDAYARRAGPEQQDAPDGNDAQEHEHKQDTQDREWAQSAWWVARGMAHRTAEGPGRRRVRARARSECRAA